MATSALLCVVVLGSLGCCCCQMTIRSLNIRSDIRYRFATTLVSSTLFNDHAQAHEAVFEVTLPKEAFISNFSMIIEEKEYVGEVKEKLKAKQQYQAAKEKGQSAGYVSIRARHSNKFNINVNVAAGTSVTFHLTYQQLLVRCHGYYEHKVHVNPRQKVSALKIEVYIQENRDITYLTTPGLTNDVITDFDISDNTLTTVNRPSPKSAYIVYEPSPEEQGPSGFHDKQFVVRYDVTRTSSAGEVLVVDGYFVHFFAPQNETSLKPIPKDITFIIDVSGSMTGRKLTQVKGAMNMILDELREGDRFSILLFDNKVKMWKDRMVPVNRDYILQAKQFVEMMQAVGSTDIHGAFDKGLEFLLNDRDQSHVPIVFFLTDGQPTSGVRDPVEIASSVRRWNEGVSAIFSLAFGDDADYNLLKKISAQNDGIARKIYEASDAAKQVQGFYDEISTTLLTSVKIQYLNSTVDPESLTKTNFKNFFNGSEIVICGRMADDIQLVDDMGITITGTGFKGDVVLVLPNSTVDDLVIDEDLVMPENPFFSMPRDFTSIIEKSWAYLTIKELLQKKLQTTAKIIKEDIDKRVLKLSLKYNFVTPLTAMVATKPEQTEPTAIDIEGDDYKPKENIRPSYGLSHRSSMSAVMNSRPSYLSGARYPNPKKHRRVYSPHIPSYSGVVDMAYVGPFGINPPPTMPPILDVLAVTMRTGAVHPSTTSRNTYYTSVHTSTTPTGRPNKSKPRKDKGRRKHKKQDKIRKGRKCRNVSVGHLEGVAVGVANRSETVLCSKMVGRVRHGGFDVLPAIRGGPQVTIFFTKGPAKFINGFEKIVITSSGASVEVDVSLMMAPSTMLDSMKCVTNKMNSSHLTIKCPDVHVIVFKHRTEYRRKCFDSYFVSVQIDKKLTKRKGKKQLDVWSMMKKGRPLSPKTGLESYSICDGHKVTKIKLKKPKHRNVT
ncbi:inter-alpha-trypsin inhibitor heavy chain H3-like [Gigantopelta aegis]|uniref:inter-alpha-trypsin inhibitor heavy chain H3-like n=1 Tax=Gigantopelta aegis TaxID=1735272 RepID=UPI001B88C307|nr:inter-alpha-trypsin inhibitor heavy chain H3-like [Gigantopelta aegis]